MSIFVFLGPTLRQEEARIILDAIYLPPVAMGDVSALITQESARPQAIAIIDGFFSQVPAVWHKEILFALSCGVRVLGSSSMGALRAAELHSFGMEGVGKVYQAFRDGILEDDDEVALIHAPAELGYLPLSEALVNIREGLNHAESRGLIRQETHRMLLGEAKRMFYPERSWPNIMEIAARLGVAGGELSALREYVRRESPDVKRDDAIELLRFLSREQAAGIAPHRPNFEFRQTSFWNRLKASGRTAPGSR